MSRKTCRIDYDKYKGAPFKKDGDSLVAGINCYNLIRRIFKDIGKADWPPYSYPDCDRREVPAMVDAIIQSILRDEDNPYVRKIGDGRCAIECRSCVPEPECLVTLAINPRFAHHMGIVMTWPYFIHILEDSHVTVERLDSLVWRKRIRGYYVPR